MLPDRVSNPGPLTYESDALPIALRGPACKSSNVFIMGLSLYVLLLLKPNIGMQMCLTKCQ